MQWDDGLDPAGVHYRIAASDHRRIGILAGPGTGKTQYGLMRRVARLLEQAECQPDQMLLVTFTRTAAQDLVAKLEDTGVPGADKVWAGTLHSFCFRLLLRDDVLTATGRVPRALMEHEEKVLLQDLGSTRGTLKERRAKLRAFEAGWARMTSEHPGLAMNPDDQSFESMTIRWLRHHRAMLVGEVVPIAYRYLLHNPHVPERTLFRHVLVDEYQDLNTIEQRLVDLLVAVDGSLCVVGDDDQSIYRFRFAHPEGIQEFVLDSASESHAINACGRCPAPILSIANQLMHAAPGRTKVDLDCTQATPGSVAIVQWADLDEELQGLTSAVVAAVNAQGREPGDVILLVNRRKIGYRLRDAINAQGVDARSFFQDDALRSNEQTQEALVVLRLLANPDERTSFRAFLGFGDPDGRSAAYARLSETARALGVSERQALEKVQQGQVKLAASAFLRRLRLLQDRVSILESKDLPGIVDLLFPPGVQDIADIREMALGLLATAASPFELVEQLVRAVTQPEVPQSPTFVRVMSLHKSKGLTSRVVIVASAVDGIVPTVDQDADEAERQASFDEQRRLFYVALTRSSDELILSGPKRMPFEWAMGTGARQGGIRRVHGVLMYEVFASPYFAELGPTQPVTTTGTAWLAGRIDA